MYQVTVHPIAILTSAEIYHLAVHIPPASWHAAQQAANLFTRQYNQQVIGCGRTGKSSQSEVNLAESDLKCMGGSHMESCFKIWK